jgi:hypothetical protein
LKSLSFFESLSSRVQFRWFAGHLPDIDASFAPDRLGLLANLQRSRYATAMNTQTTFLPMVSPRPTWAGRTLRTLV